MEVERKFLVPDPPDLDGTESDEIEQGYLASVRTARSASPQGQSTGCSPRSADRASRVRRRRSSWTARTLSELWPLTEGRRLRKRRHLIPHGELEIELDVYEGDLDGLVVAEIEFASEEEARAFEPPGWIGEEVTGDERYLNETLATRGKPTNR